MVNPFAPATEFAPASLRLMSVLSNRLSLLLVPLVTGLGAASKTTEETVFLFENRKVAVAVPEGLGFAATKDDRGLMTVRIQDRKEKISLQMTFLPDAEGRFGNARARKEFMHENFQEFL